MSNFKNKHKNNSLLYSKKNKYGFSLWYFIIMNKKITPFNMKGIPLKRHRMKKRLNINQTVLLGSYVSRSQLYFHIPIHSE